MNRTPVLTALGLAAALVALPAVADAQSRDRRPATGRAVPRTGAPPRSGSVRVVRPYRSYYYAPYYYSPFIGYGGFYGPYRYGYAWGYPSFGYGYPAYGYGYPAYGYGRYRAYGGVRIDLPQKDAEVYVDGYFAGIVDEYDGAFQQLNLEPGAHRIEIRAPGFMTINFEVNIQPGRTITYRTALRPAP
jgi:hypothetical protein